MNLDSLVLQEYVATANNPEYKGDYDIINSKFPEFENVDPVVLQEYVLTANNPEYKNDYNIINGKFPEFFTEETVETIDPPKIESPYLQDREFGKFVTGRGMPVEIEALSEKDKVKAKKASKEIESNKVNENYLKSLNYIEVPGENFKSIPSKPTALGIEETFIEGQYNSLIEQSSFPDGQINPSFQSNLDQWFQTDEGSAWWEKNWYNPVNPYVVSKQGLKEDVGYQTGSSVLSKVNLLAGKVLMQDESASLEDQVSKNILQDTENSFNPLIQKGISYGGEVNNVIALNKEIGKILSEQGIKAEDIINPNNPSQLNRNYEIPPSVLERAKQNIALSNAKATSEYQDPIVAQSGYHQREIIKLSTNNSILNPLNLGDSKTFLDNQKQIKFHKDEINKLKQDYFKDEKNGIPSQWYDPLSGSMIKRNEATSSQEQQESERIASAQEKWGDTNIETLYEQENKLANEVIYLAKTAWENFSDIENDVSLFDVGRQVTMADGKYQKMLSSQAASNTLSPNLMYLPGSNIIATNFNKKLDELLRLQKAIDLNFKPTDVDVPAFRFFDYLGSETMKAFGKLGEDNEAIQKTNEALNFIELTKDTIGDKKTAELKEMWEPGMNKSSAVALVDGAKVLTQFALTRKIAGKSSIMVKDGIKQLTTKIAGNSKVAQGVGNIVSAMGEEAYIIELRNQAVRPINQDPMSKLFALGAGTAGSMIKGAQNTLLKTQTYRNLLTTLNKSKLATNIINGVAQPTLGTFNIIAGQVGERSILEDITMREALKDATTFENFVNTFIMVGSAKAANPISGLTRLYNAGVNDFYAYKGRINIEANKAAKVLGFEGKNFGKEDGALTNKEVNNRATSLRNKEGLNKPDSELTAEQIKRKNNIRESVKSLKDQVLYNETAKFIEATYGKNEYANIYTIGRMLASGQEPTTAMKRSIGNMSSVDQAYSIIADVNGPFSNNKRAQKDILDYVKNYKNFIDGIRRVGKTANDPKLESRLIEEFELLQSEVTKPLAILEAMKKNLTGEELSIANEKIKSLKIKQQKFVDNLNAELGENVTKRRQKIRGKVADIISKQDVVKYEVLSNEEFLKRFKEKGTEGLFVNDKGEMFVNEDYAKEINNVSVDSHELLHPAMNVTLNKLAKNGKLKPFIDEFKSSLPANVLAEAKRIIDERADITDKDYTREWFNVVSDVLQSGRIKVTNTRSNMQRLADTFTEFFKTETPMKDVDFETGNEAYEFIKRYSKTFREGKTDTSLEEAVVSKLKRFEKSEGTERSAEKKINEKEINKFTKTKEGKPMTRVEWFEFTGEMNDKGELINQNKIGDSFESAIQAKIKGNENSPGWIFGETTREDLISDFKFRLRKRGFYDKKIEEFNPEVNDNFSGYMADIINNVYKDVLAANTKRVKTTSLDKQQEVMQREGKEMASSDMTAEELTDISLEKERQAKAKEKEPKETTASKIGMPKEAKTPSGKVESNKYIEKVVNEIKFKDLKDITTEPGPNQTISPFLSNLKAKVATDGNVKKDISQGMGKNTKEKVKYLETNFEKLAKSLDPTYFSGLIEREISTGKKVTLPKGLIQKDIGSGYTSDWYGKKAVGTKSAKTGITSNLKRIRLNPDFNFNNKANAKIFADAFKSQGRYEGIAGQMGAKAVIDVIEKSLGTGNKVDNKIKDIYEIQGRDLPADYAKNFKQQILKAGIERSSTAEKENKILLNKIKKLKVFDKAFGKQFAGFYKDLMKELDLEPMQVIAKDGTIRNAKDNAEMIEFIETVWPKFLPGSMIGSGSFANTKSGKGFIINATQRFKARRKAISNETHGLSKEKLAALKEMQTGVGKVWEKITEGNTSYLKSEKFQELISKNYEGFDIFIDQLQKMIEQHPNSVRALGAMFKGSSTSSSHMLRMIAFPKGYEKNWKGTRRPEREHVLVASEFGEMLFKNLLDPSVDIKTLKKLAKDNYFQILINKVNDGKLRQAGLASKMPEGFWESWQEAIKTGDINKAKSVWVRYFNPKVNKIGGKINGVETFGFNPNEIFIVNKKGKLKTLADTLKIGEEEFGRDVLNPEVIAEQQRLIYEWANRNPEYQNLNKLREEMAISLDMLNAKRDATLESMEVISKIKDPIFDTPERMTNKMLVDKAKVFDKALDIARSSTAPIKKIRVFDFDDTIAKTKSKVLAERGEEKIELTAEEFAKRGAELIEEGYEMDFTDFDQVVKGKKGPLFDLIKKMKEAKGERDIFILTARAPESQLPIYEFMKAMGVEIPLENITGLGRSEGKAKANWIVDKAAEGYNDFFFADDAVSNVKAVRDALEVLDVKSKTQIAKMERSKNMSEDFNKIIEESTGIGAEKVFSDVKAKLRGGKKKGQRFFIPPSAEDMLGLVYTTLGKGKKGEAHMKFYQENLFDPYTRAMDNLSTDRVNLMADFKALKSELDVPKDLQKITESGFTNEQAVRVHLWNKAGEKIPGLSKTDLKELNDIVENNPKLKVFADQIMAITKGDGYSKPKEAWAVGTITTDLIDVLNTKKRSKYLQTWNQNVDQIYSKDNLNKLEAAYGRKYRDAVENSLERMKSGSNRLKGGNKLSNDVLDYINNSTAVTMFVNVRSALLQTISAANFINWSFNNPLRAGKAFANQPQYWKDFTKLMNSDYLVDRRNGLKLNINESEIANAAKTSKNKAKAALNYILEKGYLPTKFADSFAIASGGATFYRNRINDLIKNEGLSKSEAEIRAMKEFRAESEKSQQSSDPSKISSQQASYLGRVILQYVNTPMQYARLQKRDIQDMANRRAMPGKTLAQSNRIRLSRITYYAFVQNLIFNALQQAVFAVGFGDDELSDTDEKRLVKTANGMLDSSLRGLGLGGVTIQVLKNLGIDIYDRSKRARPEYTDSYKKLLEFSPAIKSKLGKFESAAYPFDSKKRRAEVFEKGFSLDNPAYESMAKVITATTNVPLDRVFKKANNLKTAASEDAEAWQSIAMILGWPEWQLRTDDTTKKEDSKNKKSRTSLINKSNKAKTSNRKTIKRKTR